MQTDVSFTFTEIDSVQQQILYDEVTIESLVYVLHSYLILNGFDNYYTGKI